MRPDDVLNMHIKSHAATYEVAKDNYDAYLNKFTTLNRDLRTDENGVTTLHDNVPCVFTLPEDKSECYFKFMANFDLNTKGTISVLFQTPGKARAFFSDTIRKPGINEADVEFKPQNQLRKYIPPNLPRQIKKKTKFQHVVEEDDSDGDDPTRRRIYITVRAEEGAAHGHIMLRTEVSMPQLQAAYARRRSTASKDGGKPVADILAAIERRYGAKSSVARNLHALIEENERIDRMSLNKDRSSKAGGLLDRILK